MYFYEEDSVILNKGVGKVVESVRIENNEVFLTFEDKSFLHLLHEQDCCESVYIEDVVGDTRDLIGEVLLVSEKVDGDTPNDFEFEYTPESYTWSYYKFRSRKGEIVIRYLGESNGYYSEEVSVKFYEK